MAQEKPERQRCQDPRLMLALSLGETNKPIAVLVQLDLTEPEGQHALITTWHAGVDTPEKVANLCRELIHHFRLVLDEVEPRH